MKNEDFSKGIIVIETIYRCPATENSIPLCACKRCEFHEGVRTIDECSFVDCCYSEDVK